VADYLGLRVARWRETAGMTQQQLADAVGVSRPYVTLIENGKRPVTRRSLLIDLAKALGVTVSQLLGQPAPLRDRDDMVMSRAAADVRVALDGDGPAARPVARMLPDRADTVISMRAACDYPALAGALPALIGDARLVAYDGPDEDTRRVGLAALVKACVYGTFAMKTAGYVDLAARLAEHAGRAAERLDSPVHVAASQMAACQALMAEGVRRRALVISTGGADALAGRLQLDGAPGWYVSLRLQAALCAASLGDRASAAAHLDDAADVAAGLAGPDGWHRDHQPTDVNVWRVTVALESDADAERAPDLAARVDRSRLRTPQRLARLYMDTGRGMWARGDREAAVSAFMAAYDTAPGEVRHRGTVREIVGQMVRDTRLAGGSDRLRVLAARVGVDPLSET
jgi:transcriptional regulator with XRE-family HTH domain